MKEYSANNIKNVAVVGHGGSGKTSLVEAMLLKRAAPTGWEKLPTEIPCPIMIQKK